MSKDINLTVTKTEHENRESAIRIGHDYSVKNDQGFKLSKASLSQYSAVDSALLEVLKRTSHAYNEADVTVAGATLPESLETFLVDKYTVETQIASVTFE